MFEQIDRAVTCWRVWCPPACLPLRQVKELSLSWDTTVRPRRQDIHSNRSLKQAQCNRVNVKILLDMLYRTGRKELLHFERIWNKARLSRKICIRNSFFCFNPSTVTSDTPRVFKGAVCTRWSSEGLMGWYGTNGLVSNTSMQAFLEVLHASPCHLWWDCVDFSARTLSFKYSRVRRRCRKTISFRSRQRNETCPASLLPLQPTHRPLLQSFVLHPGHH